MSREAVIVEAVRTPLGKRGGWLAGVHPADLSARVLQALVERTGIDPALVEDVSWGCVSQVGEQSFRVGSAGPAVNYGANGLRFPAPVMRTATSPKPVCAAEVVARYAAAREGAEREEPES